MIPWSRLPGVTVVDVGPPRGGAIERPGPGIRPIRPYLEITTSPAGVAARAIQGNGVVASLVVRNDEIIALGGSPLAVVSRTDGIWAMYRDSLVHHDRQGTARHQVALSSVALIGSADDAAWLAGSDQAWHVDAGGTVRGPFPWRAPLTSFAIGGTLCSRDRHDARSLVCVSPDGAGTKVALPFDLEPFEQPISLEGDRLITLQGTTVRARWSSELVAKWTLQVVGVDTGAAGFAATAAGDLVMVWRPPVGSGEPVPRVFPRVGPGSLSAAAIDGEAITLYGQGEAATHGSTGVGMSAFVDEASYRAAIFPIAWEMTPLRGIAVRADGVIVVAASGPGGSALIELRTR